MYFLEELPPDLLTSIFALLPPRDLIAVARVNCRFHQLIHENFDRLRKITNTTLELRLEQGVAIHFRVKNYLRGEFRTLNIVRRSYKKPKTEIANPLVIEEAEKQMECPHTMKPKLIKMPRSAPYVEKHFCDPRDSRYRLQHLREFNVFSDLTPEESALLVLQVAARHYSFKEATLQDISGELFAQILQLFPQLQKLTTQHGELPEEALRTSHICKLETVGTPLKSYFFQGEFGRNLRKLQVDRAGIDDDALLNMHCLEKLTLSVACRISPKTVLRVVDEWERGERHIKRYQIAFGGKEWKKRDEANIKAVHKCSPLCEGGHQVVRGNGDQLKLLVNSVLDWRPATMKVLHLIGADHLEDSDEEEICIDEHSDEEDCLLVSCSSGESPPLVSDSVASNTVAYK